MRKKLFLFAILSCLVAVILGALGAHYVKVFLTIDQLASYQTANRYQWYHSFAVLIVCIMNSENEKILNRIGSIFAVGIVLFSGSIYLLALKDYLNIDQLRFLGPVTPLGGLFFITGWALLAYTVYKTMFKTSESTGH